jgi:hypothetical protein
LDGSLTNQDFVGLYKDYDSDDDGMPDWWELKYFGHLNQDCSSDYDNDGLKDCDEYLHHTNPRDTDSDNDGFTDGAEVIAGTDPLDPDSHPPINPSHVLMNLHKGLNLVAIPVDVSGMPDLKDWLPTLGDSTEIEKVMAYDEQSGRFVTLVPGASNNPSFALENGQGLIVYAKGDWSIEFDPAYCTDIDLHVGFNLIGFACPPEGYSAYDLLNDLGSTNVISIERYDVTTGAFESAGFTDTGQPAGIDFPIVPGEGYFIYMNQEVVNFNYR